MKALGSKYQIEETFAGGQATVYKALDRALNRWVAIKLPNEKVRSDPRRMEKFIEEGRKLARLDDKNVLTVLHFYDQGELDDNCYLITEWLDRTLLQVIENEQLEPNAAIQILRKILSGLGALHNVGIVHRDLKPGNIYLSDDGSQVKIGDLGIASDIGTEDTLQATPKYVAPEVYRADGVVDRRTDLYSLGMLAYELLLGKEQFEEVFSEIYGADSDKTRNARWLNWHLDAGRKAPPLKELTPAVDVEVSDVVERMMAKDPEQRFADADAALRALTDAAPGSDAITQPFRPLPLEKKKKGLDLKNLDIKQLLMENRYVQIGGGLALLLLLGLVFLFTGSTGNQQDAEAAGNAMLEAREKAVAAGAENPPLLESLSGGDARRAEGNQWFQERRFDLAEQSFLAATALFETAEQEAWQRRIEQARTAAAESYQAAMEAGGEVLKLFPKRNMEPANAAWKEAEAASEGEDHARAIELYGDAAQGYREAAEEVPVLLAWQRLAAAKQQAMNAGVGPDHPGFQQAERTKAQGSEAYNRDAYQDATFKFEQARLEYQAALELFLAARAAAEEAQGESANQEQSASATPGRFMAGSTGQEIREALALCREYVDQCREEWYADETQREVVLDPFVIDVHEVTNREFSKFVEETAHRTDAERNGSSWEWVSGQSVKAEDVNWRHPRGNGSDFRDFPDHPVVHVSAHDAQAYCEWKGQRLPSEDEWEYAARGTERRIYPWGDEWMPQRVVWAKGDRPGSRPVGSLPEGSTPEGIMDMAGNVWEWTSTRDGGKVILKGGSWAEENPANLRAAARRREEAQNSHSDDGFRCATNRVNWR